MIRLKKSKKVKTNKLPNIHKEIRHLGVIIESVDSRVGLMAEQYGDIRKDISDIKTTLNSHTEMIGRLAVDMAIVKEDVEFIKSGLKKKIDIEEFSALEKRVALLERHR